MSTREQWLTRTLRGLVLVLTALTIAAATISLVDGGLTHGAPFAMFSAWLIGPGLVVWLHPKPVFAVLWSAAAWLGGLMLVGAGPHVWAAAAVPYLMVPVLVVILFGLPVGSAIYVLASRAADARAAQPALPEAHVVSRRRA